MATARQFLTLQQFEQTYEGEKPYYEYWFGEAIQKSVPTSVHGTTQMLLGMLLMERGWRAASEVKLKLSPYGNPIPDLIADPKPIESPYPTKPFALSIEILSPSDDLGRLFQKCAHYLDWGISTVWIIDPDQRKAYCMTRPEAKPKELFLSDSLTAESEFLGTSRKTGTESSAPPECPPELLPVWRRAAEPFALTLPMRELFE